MLKEDFHTATWRRMKAMLEERLVELRELNDRPTDTETTASTRGKIAEVKRLLTLDKSASEAVDVPYQDPNPGY